MLSVPRRVQAEVQARLRPSEQLLWSGSPLPRKLAWKGWKIAAGGVAYLVFVEIMVETMGGVRLPTRNDPDSMLPFLVAASSLAGIAMVLWPLVLTARRR